MAEIVLVALNARYSHASLGVRYLLANLGGLRARASLLEFDLRRPPAEVAEAIRACEPRVIGIGAYIWNSPRVRELMRLLRQACPRACLMVGGPEVAGEAEATWRDLADYTIPGEADQAFATLCQAVLADNPPPPGPRPCSRPALAALALPYAEYTQEDLTHRITYVETSRGCPFHCAYCLSAGDGPVRYFDRTQIFKAVDTLLARGAHHIKFVDRSFNVHEEKACELLDYLLARGKPGVFFHLEAVPDRFPAAIRERLARFPPLRLQLEVGIQTWDPEVAARIGRSQDMAAAEAHLRFLRQHTQVYLHADLIAGLPGETLASFARGFDRLAALAPHEIQAGILKRLPGTRIARQEEWQMQFNPAPPYEIRSSKTLAESELRLIHRFAHQWDQIVNKGYFLETAPLLWEGRSSVFDAFAEFVEWLAAREPREHGLPLERLSEHVFDYLRTCRNFAPERVAERLGRDYLRGGALHLPKYLGAWLPANFTAPQMPAHPRHIRRQARNGAL